MKILATGDWHVRSTIPICRTDDFLSIQSRTLERIAEIALGSGNATILHSGDIFHKAKPENSQELEIMLAEIFNNQYNNYIYFIAGNHDLLYHKIENFNKGSIGVLNTYEKWEKVNGCIEFIDSTVFNFDYGEKIKDLSVKNDNIKHICLVHKYVAEDVVPFFMKDGISAKDLCERHPSFDVFVCGDNHHGFIYEHKRTGQVVINTGCITRQESTFKNYQPKVCLIDTEEMIFKFIDLPDNDPDVIIENVQEDQEEKLNRIESFIEKLKNVAEVSLDFEKNIEIYCQQNQVEDSVREKIMRSLK